MAGNGVELVWDGKRKDVERVPLPFQRVEIINESRATRQASPLLRTGPQLPPDPLFADITGGGTAGVPWRNKLIWGDNKYVLASLIEGDPSIGLAPLAGKVDLIYIDPPFATGADFSFSAQIGDLEIEKAQSIIEELAYRDTWGQGLASYLHMMHERLRLIATLLSPRGSVFVHCDTRVNSHLRLLLDEILGPDRMINEISWKRTGAHNDPGRYGMITDTLLYYSKTDSYCWNQPFSDRSQSAIDTSFAYVEKPDGSQVRLRKGEPVPEGWRRFQSVTLRSPHPRPNLMYEYKGYRPHRNGWSVNLVRMEKYDRENRLIFPDTKDGAIRLKMYLDESPGIPVQDIWIDIGKIESISAENLGYATQKPEALLRRIVETSSNPGDLVADFFVGSGTTAAVAEKLGRRWIGCDLGRFAIHTSRKRLLGIENCKPFEVLNLGRYERKYWQGINAGEAVYEYFQFIVKLYHAEPVVGFTNLHGRKGEAMVHVGATDAPVTISEVRAAMEECKANGLKALDVLGWEWEMGLNSTGLLELQQQSGVATRLFHIPHEIMDKRAVAAGDVHFYEAAYVAAKTIAEPGRTVRIELTDFLVAIDDYIRGKVGDKVKKWSDWIDYWAVDFEHDGDVFHNQWQAYRTRKEPKLDLVSGPHTYSSAGERQILVKVVDIFGNDTTALLEAEV